MREPGKAPAAQGSLREEARRRLENTYRNGASLFYLVAALAALWSLVDLAARRVGYDSALSVGLLSRDFGRALTEWTGGLVPDFAGAALIRLLGAGLFGAIGYYARGGRAGVYLLGLVLYLADTFVALVIEDWLGSVLHVIAVAAMASGLRAARQMRRLEAGAAPTDVLFELDPVKRRQERAIGIAAVVVGAIILILSLALG